MFHFYFRFVSLCDFHCNIVGGSLNSSRLLFWERLPKPLSVPLLKLVSSFFDILPKESISKIK